MNIVGTYEEICKNQKIYDYLKQLMHEQGKDGKVRSHEEPKKFYVEPKSFAELSLLTISLKTQRAKCRNFYMPIIEKLYKQ